MSLFVASKNNLKWLKSCKNQIVLKNFDKHLLLSSLRVISLLLVYFDVKNMTFSLKFCVKLSELSPGF